MHARLAPRFALVAGTPLRELVRVAGARWAIEEDFQTAKGQVGPLSLRPARRLATSAADV